MAGGDADAEARYVAPTILYPVTWEHEIMEDEIFGPILPILTYTDFDDAWRESPTSLPLWRPSSSARGRTTSIGSSVGFRMGAAR